MKKAKANHAGYVRITAPHFVAGVETRISQAGFVIVCKCAPILKYMDGWPMHKVVQYCKRKKWECQVMFSLEGMPKGGEEVVGE